MSKHSKDFSGNILTYSILGLAFCAASCWAATPPEVMITDTALPGTGNSVTFNALTGATVASNGSVSGAATLDTKTGFYSWSGTVGSLTVGGVEGQVLGTTIPKLDLGMTGTPTGSGTLYIYFTNQFSTGTGPFYFNIAGNGSASFNAYLDPTNPFGETQTIEAGIPFEFPPLQVNVSPTSTSFYETLEAVVTSATANFDDGVTGTASSSSVIPNLALACGAATGQVGVPYNSSLVASGGTPTYTYSITGSISPLVLNAGTGAITGTPTTAGTLSFTAQAVDSSGLSGTNTASQSCKIVVSPSTPIARGDTATIGFWHNKNGQALIESLNGGPTSTSLASWLATNFPYLYGAHSSNDLTGKTNANVAALFLTFFGAGGQKTNAQVLAGALASYVTSSTLAGTNAVSYGFNSSPVGTGGKDYNVGSNGSAIGLANNQSYTVIQLLLQANIDMANGTFNANAFNTIFDGINSGGDIT